MLRMWSERLTTFKFVGWAQYESTLRRREWLWWRGQRLTECVTLIIAAFWESLPSAWAVLIMYVARHWRSFACDDVDMMRKPPEMSIYPIKLLAGCPRSHSLSRAAAFLCASVFVPNLFLIVWQRLAGDKKTWRKQKMQRIRNRMKTARAYYTNESMRIRNLTNDKSPNNRNKSPEYGLKWI